MEASLLKFIERVRAESSSGENGIASEYTMIKNENGFLKQKYGLTTTAGGLKENAKKNRYKDILPYDQTRVVLRPTTPEYSCDYINANFIKGVAGSNRYIATQGPLSNTVVDLWRMVWEYDIKVIIMACKEIELGKRKCEVYWSPLDAASTFGPFTVSTVAESPTTEEVIVRTLAVKYCDRLYDAEIRLFTLRTTEGLEHDYYRSAGCGRTGVICAIDIVNDLLHKKQIGEDFNIMDLVLELRRQRPSAVQTKEQYEFVFHTVAQIFEKVLHGSSQNHQPASLSLYTNVVPPKPALRSFSIGNTYNHNTRKSPSLRPRSSQPPSSVNMNDTYAVVNKFKQPGTAPPHVPHYYDNERLNSQKTSANDLYSIVKPKNRPVANTPTSTVPVHDRTWQLNHRPPEDTDNDGYESLPAEFQMRDSKVYPSLPQVPSDRHSHSDDDYEYVANPIRESSPNQGSIGGIGFKCRVKKPKGPRDPPSQWNRPER